ncbi:MAG: ABC transporter [Legionella sp.]|nr:MAG: ABC transporter [Legionella sp.]
MTKINVDNISLQFRIYKEGASTAKEYFSNLFNSSKKKSPTDFMALQNISFSVQEGERVGIVGRNGAGKSTLLKTLSQVYKPTSGKITVKGKIAPLLEVGAGFHPDFSGRENIYFNGAILGYTKSELKALEQEIIEFSELEDFIDTPVKYYSTGMYMRLAFTMATTYKPDILILDELFVGGDAKFVKRGKDRMNKMIDRSNMMILVSHDDKLLRSLCQRFIWLENGRIMADGDATVLDKYSAF